MLALGCASLRELEARCTWEEVELWLEFLAVEPTGDQRADDRARSIVMKIHDVLPTRVRLERRDILPTPFDIWKREQDAKVPELVAEKNKSVARGIAAWLGVKLGDNVEWL